MEVLLDIKSVRSSVNKYKNYCPLELEDILGGQPYDAKTLYSGDKKHPYYDFDKSAEISGSDLFDKYKNDPLSAPSLNRKSVEVLKSNEKVTIKIYRYNLHREIGKPYFRKSTSYVSLTYNIKRNQFYFFLINNYHKKRNFSKTLRCLSPYLILNHFRHHLVDALSNRDDVDKVFNVFFKGIYEDMVNYVDLLEYVVKKQGFKLPNNFDVFADAIGGNGFYGRTPTKLDGKRNGFKYIDTIMGINILKGDKLRRVLHKVSGFNLGLYYEMASYFKDDFILSRPDEDLIKIFNSNIGYSSLIGSVLMTKQEKINMYNIIMELINTNSSDLYSISDHLNIKNKLAKYETVKWKSKTYDEFVDEHDEWSRNLDSYTKGVTQRRYNKEFLNHIEKPFEMDGIKYYPVVLNSSDDYNRESTVQTNCVRTYIHYAHSLIVSLRRDSKDSYERLTIEVNLIPDEDVRLLRKQTKAKRNSTPDDSWSLATRELDDRIEFINKNGLFTLPEMDVIYTRGLPRHAKVDNRLIHNDGYSYWTVCWDDEEVDSITGLTYFPVIDDEVTQDEIDYLLTNNTPNYVTEDDDLPL